MKTIPDWKCWEALLNNGSTDRPGVNEIVLFCGSDHWGHRSICKLGPIRNFVYMQNICQSELCKVSSSGDSNVRNSRRQNNLRCVYRPSLHNSELQCMCLHYEWMCMRVFTCKISMGTSRFLTNCKSLNLVSIVEAHLSIPSCHDFTLKRRPWRAAQKGKNCSRAWMSIITIQNSHLLCICKYI